MRKDAWVEYGSPGTTVLSRTDIQRAIARLEQSLERPWNRPAELEQLCIPPRARQPHVHLAKPDVSPA